MPLSAGTRIGPYVIEASLGAGGMGEVYRARDTRLDRDVAIKLLPDLLARDPDALSRFEREAKAVAALSHPNILAIHEFGSANDVVYAVTELLEGDTLRERLTSGPIAPRRAVEQALQIARGLAAAHDRGIVHRDLKPENVFITRDNVVKILDFGIAKVRAEESSSGETRGLATTPGVVMGTVAYMSPEQARGGATDARSDLFSFGVVLYEMLGGRRPFGGDTTQETIAALLQGRSARSARRPHPGGARAGGATRAREEPARSLPDRRRPGVRPRERGGRNRDDVHDRDPAG